MTSAFSRSGAALAAALLATLPLASPAKPATAVLPIDWSLAPQQISTSCAKSIAATKIRVDAIVRTKSARTFESVVLPLENVSSDFNDELAAQAFLYNVSTDKAVRKASLQCSTDAGNALSEISARPDLYRALAAAQASGTAKGPSQQKLTQLWLTALKRSGSGLADAQRREFVSLQQKLTDYQNK